jgi:hypothetical protein
LPAAVGVNMTEIWQAFPAASEAPHRLVCEKSPEVEICVMFKETFPVLVKVTV